MCPLVGEANCPNRSDDVQCMARYAFSLSFDEYGLELIAKSNKAFRGTGAEIPVRKFFKKKGLVDDMDILRRLALITTISKDDALREQRFWPVTPKESEQLRGYWDNNLPVEKGAIEDLALVLYDRSEEGTNPREASALYDSLSQNRKQLGLSESDLGKSLLVVNAGLEVDPNMPHGVRPVVLPGVTKARTDEVLEKEHEHYGLFVTVTESYGPDQDIRVRRELGLPFVDGSKTGLPEVYEIEVCMEEDIETRIKALREFDLPPEPKSGGVGLRVLSRYGSKILSAKGVYLTYQKGEHKLLHIAMFVTPGKKR